MRPENGIGITVIPKGNRPLLTREKSAHGLFPFSLAPSPRPSLRLLLSARVKYDDEYQRRVAVFFSGRLKIPFRDACEGEGREEKEREPNRCGEMELEARSRAGTIMALALP